MLWWKQVNCVDPDQTALQEQFDLCLHCLLWPVCEYLGCQPPILELVERLTTDPGVVSSNPSLATLLLWRLIMISFLWSFSPLWWFKKGGCQLLISLCTHAEHAQEKCESVNPVKRQSQLLSSALSSACYFKSHFCKQCGPRSDCSFRSSLIRVHTVCLYAKIGLKSLPEYSADNINRRHFQMQFFLAL